MTEQEIVEYNNRCAKFLGYELITPAMRKYPEKWKHSYWEINNKNNVHTSKYVLCMDGYLSFHSNWNNIMEMVEAIEKLGFRFEIWKMEDADLHRVDILKMGWAGESVFDSKDGWTKLTHATKKEAIVSAINQFLIWYENDKKDKN